MVSRNGHARRRAFQNARREGYDNVIVVAPQHSGIVLASEQLLTCVGTILKDRSGTELSLYKVNWLHINVVIFVEGFAVAAALQQQASFASPT